MDQPATASAILGAAVFDAEGERLGQIEDLHFDLVEFRILAAVVGHGGFMGLGEERDPLDWRLLRWDDGLGGYVTGIALSDDEPDGIVPGPGPALA